jgi:hypothetical protein
MLGVLGAEMPGDLARGHMFAARVALEADGEGLGHHPQLPGGECADQG